MNPSRQSRPRVQLWMLRLMIAILLTGLPGALLPEIAFQKFAWLMGYGKQPITPLIVYLSGNAGFAYVTIAVLIWAISRDLTRYQPLVRLCGWTMVVAGPAYLLIDLQCPLPLWWTLMDSVGCFLIGITLLWACPEWHGIKTCFRRKWLISSAWQAGMRSSEALGAARL